MGADDKWGLWRDWFKILKSGAIKTRQKDQFVGDELFEVLMRLWEESQPHRQAQCREPSR
jgi:hypothetical protein